MLLTVLAWVPGASLQAQYIRQLSAHQFLNAAAVFHAVCDSKGFLWFCTDHGLVKYDGRTTQHFTMQEGLADNMVFNIYEDRQGRIWPFCYNGRYCFLRGDSVHNETNDSLLAALPHTDSYVTCMADNGRSALYFGFLSRSLLQLKDGRARWLAEHPQSGGLLISDDRIGYSKSPTPGVNVPSADRRFRLIADATGLKIVSQGRPVWQLKDPALTDKAVTDLLLDGTDRLIVCTIHSVEVIFLRTGARLRLLSGIRASGCSADPAGNFWITTIDRGVYFVHHELERIRPLPGARGQDLVRINNNRLVFIRDNALFELLPAGSGIGVKKVEEGVRNYFNPLLRTSELSVYYDNWNKQVTVRYPKSGGEDYLPLFFKAMYPMGSGLVVGVGKNSVYRFQLEQGHLRPYGMADTFGRKIGASCQDPVSGAVYIASGGMIYRVGSGQAGPAPIGQLQWPRDIVSMCVQDSYLYVATGEQRYYSCYPIGQNGRVMAHSTPFYVHALAPAAYRSVMLSSEGADYLVGTVPGPDTPRLIRYPFAPAAYEQIAFLGSRCIMQLDGRPYHFDTSLLNRPAPPASVFIKRLTINGRDYAARQVEIRNTTRLDVTVRIGQLDFGNSRGGIAYRLLGVGDSRWQLTVATEIAFVLRKPGRYRIELAPEGHTEPGAVASVAIYVRTPFLQSATFLVLCGIAVLLVFAGVLLLLNRHRRNHFRRELNYLKMEHRAINALLNPHFIFNSINNIQGLIHKLKAGEAAEYLAILSRLIRQNLENLQYNLIALEDELALISRYLQLQNLRFGGNIHLSLDTDGVDREQVRIPPLLLHTFVENAIVHGYRYKDRPFHIGIRMEQAGDQYIRVTITDNGIGLRAAAKKPTPHRKTSMGIAFNQRRLERLSGFYHLRQSITVTDLSAQGGQGTAVEIVLSVKLRELFESRHLPVH